MAPRPYCALQNSHGHAKEFLRNLYIIWARVLKKVRQPCSSESREIQLSSSGLSAHQHNRTYKPGPGSAHSSRADFIALTHEGETKALSFTYYPSTLQHKQQRPGNYHGLNGNADKLFQVTAVINTYLQHVFPCARKQFFPGTHSEYTISTIRSYQQEENKYGTFRTGSCLLI